MAGPSISELLVIAGNQPTSNPLLRRGSLLQYFFKTWLRLDLTTLAAAVTIFGTIRGLIRSSKSLAIKFYWWFTKFCTASVSITANDRLNKEILNWIGDQVLTRQETRILTARTEALLTDTSLYSRLRSVGTERNDVNFEKRIPIQYLPTFGTTWFFFERNIFLVRRMPARGAVSSMKGHSPTEYVVAPEGNEPLIVMCLGRSVAPIKRFLEACRDFAELQRSKYVTVRVTSQSRMYGQDTWATTILRPMRPLETVHFDEDVKAELLADIKSYLDPNTRKFYNQRGIPYRRGYLFHGPAGTGKTSLSIALAGHFSLELYLMHIPSVKTDGELEQSFTALPPRCLVLLEDIDAVGISRRPDSSTDDSDFDEDLWKESKNSRYVTLSGLLNVLDGVASQEGRIVLMTSNHAERLDKALVRPGRIDKMILMGPVSQRTAELMFLRMYAPDPTHASHENAEVVSEELDKVALEFSVQIPEDTITPAQLQGYLLHHRGAPRAAVAGADAWVEGEKVKIEERKEQNRKAAARWREERKRKAAEKGRVSQFPPGMEEYLTPGLRAMIEKQMGNASGGASDAPVLPPSTGPGKVESKSEWNPYTEKERAPDDAAGIEAKGVSGRLDEKKIKGGDETQGYKSGKVDGENGVDDGKEQPSVLKETDSSSKTEATAKEDTPVEKTKE